MKSMLVWPPEDGSASAATGAFDGLEGPCKWSPSQSATECPAWRRALMVGPALMNATASCIGACSSSMPRRFFVFWFMKKAETFLKGNLKERP